MTPPAAPARQQSPVHRTPAPYLHLQDRPYLLQPIDLAKPMAVDSRVRGAGSRLRWNYMCMCVSDSDPETPLYTHRSFLRDTHQHTRRSPTR